MSICPWCKGNTPRAYDTCPLCGKNPHEHPSVSGGNFSSFDSFDDDDAGGLDVQGAIAPLSHADGPDSFGSHALDDAPQGVSLELDAPPLPSRRPLTPKSLSLSQQPSMPSPAVGSAPPAFDTFDLMILADFGPAPQKITEFPLYAIRVTSRRRELRKQAQLARHAFAQSEQAYHRALADMAEQVRPTLAAAKEFSPFLEPFERMEQQLENRFQALEQRNLEKQENTAVVDREIEALHDELNRKQADTQAAAMKLDQQKERLQRIEVAFRRAEIELRNAQTVARAAAGPEAKVALPQDAQKIRDLTSVLEERRQALEAPRAEVEQAQRVWNDADLELKAVQRRMAELQKKRRLIEQSYTKEIAIRTDGVAQAQLERQTALVALGSALLEGKPQLVPQALQQEIQTVRDTMARHEREQARLDNALTLADDEAVKKGWIILAAAVGIAFVLLVFLIAWLGRSEPPIGMNTSEAVNLAFVNGEAYRFFGNYPGFPA